MNSWACLGASLCPVLCGRLHLPKLVPSLVQIHVGSARACTFNQTTHAHVHRLCFSPAYLRGFPGLWPCSILVFYPCVPLKGMGDIIVRSFAVQALVFSCPLSITVQKCNHSAPLKKCIFKSAPNPHPFQELLFSYPHMSAGAHSPYCGPRPHYPFITCMEVLFAKDIG